MRISEPLIPGRSNSQMKGIAMHLYIRLIVYGTLILLATFTPAFAQGVGSTRGLPDAAGGSHVIQGHVYLPNGRSAEQGIIVRLESGVLGTRRTTTDASGTFLFNSLPAAEYTVIVDGGPDFEPVRESVVIYGTSGGVGSPAIGTAMRLDLQLVPKGSGPQPEAAFLGVPKDALEHYKKGLQSARSGNSKKAVEELNNAISIHPAFAPALSELGVQYLKLGEMAKLAEAMESLVKLTPSDARAHLHLGIAFFNQKKFSDAENQLREAIKLSSADPAAHYYLGMTLVSLKQYADAEKELELAISNGGDNLALAHKYLGGLYMSSKKNAQAADELEKYLKLEPKATDAERIKATIKDLRSKQ
jgi:Flp pilus assembly protein TadD